MTCYAVYLERAEDGLCMAHVPALPGCMVRATGRDEALGALSGAIRAYHTWLRDHGEAAPREDEPLELEVAGEVEGTGPFNPGDAAALFPSDREPTTPEEMEAHFRLMGHARADLLALAGRLCILRHIGNAEEWYVSRLVAPESLPAEWQDDEDMPLWDFLVMERRAVLDRLRALSAEERAAVFYPTAWTSHPDEAWTLRKVLRRFLEHEREHTGQVREVLELRRSAILADLHTARQELLADWEAFGVEGLRLMGRGEVPLVEPIRDIDAWNREHAAARQDQPWEAVLADLHAAREALLDALQALAPCFLGQKFPFPWGGEGTPVDWLSVYPAHDREHTEELAVLAGVAGR